MKIAAGFLLVVVIVGIMALQAAPSQAGVSNPTATLAPECLATMCRVYDAVNDRWSCVACLPTPQPLPTASRPFRGRGHHYGWFGHK